MSICDIAGVPAEQCASSITYSADHVSQTLLIITALVVGLGILIMTLWADRLKKQK